MLAPAGIEAEVVAPAARGGTITLEADVTTADNYYLGDEQVLVPAGSSSTRIDTFTGLTSPATRCELEVVKRERFPAARGGGGPFP